VSRFKNIAELITYLRQLGYTSIKKRDTASVNIYTSFKARSGVSESQQRTQMLDELATKAGGVRLATGGKAGSVRVGNYKIFALPKNSTNTKAPGVDNEKYIVDVLTDMITEFGENKSCDVLFTDKGGHKFLCRDVKRTVHVGTATRDRRKADIVLKGRNDYPISIKKDNANFWESADTYWGKTAAHYITQESKAGNVAVEPLDTRTIKITPSISIEATDGESRDVVFGNDISLHGCVVIRTFAADDFTYTGEDNTIHVSVDYIVETLNHLPKSKRVWFNIRNDRLRRSINNYPGTRVLGAVESSIPIKTVRIKRDKRTD
jgi:hypothetical protein